MSASADTVKGIFDIFDPGAQKERKVTPSTGLRLPAIQDLRQLLLQLLRDAAPVPGLSQDLQGNLAEIGGRLGEVTPESRFQDSLSAIEGVVTPQLQQLENQISQDFAARGLTASGISLPSISGARATALNQTVSEALQRSFSESLDAKQAGAQIQGGLLSSLFGPQAGFADILSRLLGGLTASGISGASSQFGANRTAQASIFKTQTEASSEAAFGGR